MDDFDCAGVAAAVIGQAWKDAIAAPAPTQTWPEARQFFERAGPVFRFWCAGAGLDPDAVQASFQRRILEGPPRVEDVRQQRRRRRQRAAAATDW